MMYAGSIGISIDYRTDCRTDCEICDSTLFVVSGVAQGSLHGCPIDEITFDS